MLHALKPNISLLFPVPSHPIHRRGASAQGSSPSQVPVRPTQLREAILLDPQEETLLMAEARKACREAFEGLLLHQEPQEDVEQLQEKHGQP